ncbi:hypothetical protein Vqi01_48790 [Micromonospora qiuiae]|uniref:VOC domain-containing protein n=1 Tax=Micromonospora qiuiae TaxID=502268 RepID=A0ABQ4JGN4_9ACTN|nr:glyoxalase [Micromonospora qiuiae]GIJ29717.1 hypothetical protein Vqi01_48790 [Micromonospora qiuiae]
MGAGRRPVTVGALHHVELWVPDLSAAMRSWGWLLGELSLNHLAFHAGSPAAVDRLVEQAPAYGWELLFPDRHPYAGGPDTYAGYLADGQGYEVELVANS